MKGTVEIYGITPEGSEDLVFQGPNMSVVGFAEHITDFLTTPSSVKYPLATNSNILDASNYEIQAFSMSKQKDNFTKDQHSYKTTNFLSNPEFNALEFSAIWMGSTSHPVWAMTPDGSAFGWGDAPSGSQVFGLALASGTLSGTGISKIDSGLYAATRINSDGSLSSWASEVWADVDPWYLIANTPVGTGFVDIGCGVYMSIAIDSNGSLSSWGDEGPGCAYAGDTNCNLVSDTPSGTGFIKVAAGYSHTMALSSDGSIKVWGTNLSGVVSNAPTGGGFTQLDGGQYWGMALSSDGSIVSWGADYYGQVSDTPTEKGFVKIAAGAKHGLALRENGTIASWGNNNYNQISNIPATSKFIDIGAGWANSVAVRYTGSIAAWGAVEGSPFGKYRVIEDAPQTIGTSGGWELINANVSGDIVVGPTIDSSGYLITSELSSGSLTQAINFSGGGDSAFTAPYFSGTEFTFSVDLKFNKDDPPVTAAGTIANGSDYSGYSHVELRLNGNSPRTSIRWDSSGQAHLHNNSYTKWDGGIKKLSDDWYRVFVTGYNSGRGKSLSAIIYPSIGDAGVDSNIPPTTGRAGSIYISRPQLELGRVPTSFVPSTSSLEVSSNRDDKIAYSILNETIPFGQVATGLIGQPNIQVFNYIVVEDSGGKSLSATYGDNISEDRGVSAYLPETSSIKRVNYIDRSLTPGARTPVEEALGIEFTKDQIPAALGLSSNLHLSSFVSDWTYTTPYIPAIGRHIAYLGSYVSKKGSSATLQPIITYVSAYDIIGLENPSYAQGLTIGIEGASGIDKYGYWTLSANGEAVSDVISPQVSRFYKEASLGFSSTGEITYSIRIGNVAEPNTEAEGESSGEDDTGGGDFPQKDSPLLNIFGGVDTLGLWGLDLAAIKENSISSHPPYRELVDTSSTFVEPVRKYKLFNKINLSDNLVKCEGISTLRGLVGFYKAFELRWRISFR